MNKIKLAELKSFCEAALMKAGVTEENAKIVTEVLMTTDTFGVLTHGTKNLNQYIQKCMQAVLTLPQSLLLSAKVLLLQCLTVTKPLVWFQAIRL